MGTAVTEMEGVYVWGTDCLLRAPKVLVLVCFRGVEGFTLPGITMGAENGPRG